MSLLKLLLLASSFLSAFWGLANAVNAEPLTVEEMRSQASHRSSDLRSISSTQPATSQPISQSTVEDDSDETEIRVTGTKSPFAPSSAPTYIIPKSEIEQQNPSTAAEILRNLPGFGFSINQSIFQINGRSFGSNVSTYHGGTDLNGIPADAIESVELKGGTSATLYGSEAFGGVINLTTKKTPQPLKATAGVEIGSYGYQRYRVGYGGTLDNVNFRLGYERLSTDNNYPVPVGAANRNPADGRLFNGDTRIDNFYGSVEAPLDSRNSFSLEAYKTASRRGLLYFGFPLQRDRLDHDLLNIGATVTTKLGDGNNSTLKTTIGYNQDFFNTYGPAGGFFRTGSLDSKALSGRVENQWQISPTYKLTSGLDINSSSIRGDVFISGSSFSANNGVVSRDRLLVALFALNTLQLDDNFQLELGLRQNFTNDFGSYLNPTVGTRWNITPDLIFRNSLAVLQRNPGLDQLYVPDSIHRWLPNPNLVPEKGVAYTAGFDLNLSKSFVAQLTYFGSSLSDRLGIIAGRWENVGQVSTNGIEAALKLQITPEFSSFFNYTYTDAKVTSSRTASEVGLQLNYYSGSRRALFAAPGVNPAEFSPAYLSLDFNAKVPLYKDLSLTLSLENLTDQSYEKTNRIYQPGLTYRIGLQASF